MLRYATTKGISVPRSPNAPAHSMRSKRLRVATLRAGSCRSESVMCRVGEKC